MANTDWIFFSFKARQATFSHHNNKIDKIKEDMLFTVLDCRQYQNVSSLHVGFYTVLTGTEIKP